MDQDLYEMVKRSATPLTAHIQIKLRPDFNEAYIEGFARYMHPGTAVMADPGHCSVYLPGGIIVYTLYSTGIVQTNQQSGEKIFFSRI